MWQSRVLVQSFLFLSFFIVNQKSYRRTQKECGQNVAYNPSGDPDQNPDPERVPLEKT